MSGGAFDYAQYRIEDIACQIEERIASNDCDDLDEYQQVIGAHYKPETIAAFREGARLLRRAAIYAQRIDWLISGDDGEESFHKRLTEELAKRDSNEL